MNATWPDLTTKVEPVHQEALRAVADAAATVGSDWFLTGATARDWIFTLIHGIETIRATRDADIGIALAGWGEFEKIRDEIIASGLFKPGRTPHQLIHGRVQGFHIDLVPFGQLGGAEKEIAWPPDQDIVMNVIGFEEAYASSIIVLAASDLPVKVASPPGLMLLKIFAWEDRKLTQPGKDAMDIRLLLNNYAKIAGRDLWEIEGLMEAESFDADLAAAHLLGLDVARIASSDTRQALIAILERELHSDNGGLLQYQIAAGTEKRRIDVDRDVEKYQMLLEGFKRGVANDGA